MDKLLGRDLNEEKKEILNVSAAVIIIKIIKIKKISNTQHKFVGIKLCHTIKGLVEALV